MGKLVFSITFWLLLLSVIPHPGDVHAQTNNKSFISIVNPVRISTYTKDPVESLVAEYDQIAKRGLPATWLLTHDSISHPGLSAVLTDMDERQELGIFLEVTQEFSKKADVEYNATNSWHRATSLFLSGYSQENRKKLIDAVFVKFKNTFGYYPKSVGAWWVDSYSLSYMKDKYGITGVLGVSDQYDLDGYQVWGTYFSTPFYPSKINAAIPAKNIENKLDVVTLRWAARDPLNGYLSPSHFQASLYSIQDYVRVSLSEEYFRKLVQLYSASGEFNQFGQVTIGLEADYSPDFYTGTYAKWLDMAVALSKSGVTISSMVEFTDWYRDTFPRASPAHVLRTEDLLEETFEVVWYQNTNYRIGLSYNTQTQESEVIDFRVYPENYVEPFFQSPNKAYSLSINLPHIIDTVINKGIRWKFNAGRLNSVLGDSSKLELNFEKGSIILIPESVRLSEISVPSFVERSKQLDIKHDEGKVYLYPLPTFYVGENGIVARDYSPNIPFTIETKLEKYKIPASLALIVIIGVFMYLARRFRIMLPSLVISLVVLGVYILTESGRQYYVSQSEADALSVLSNFHQGKVLVYDRDCLRCTFTTPYKPAAAAGKKGYVERYSKHKIMLDFSFVTAVNSSEARKILKENDIKYVYLSRYESYIENLPYPPEDIGLKRIYENANVEIWVRVD